MKFFAQFLLVGSFLSASLMGCGAPGDGQDAELKVLPTIGLKTMWPAGKSINGRKQYVYCPLNAALPEGYYASRLAGDCSILQGGQKSGVTALIAEEIRTTDKVLCIMKNSDMPYGWTFQKGPFGTVSCGMSGVQIQKI